MRTKPHYLMLDGLRGIAAFTVLVYHIFEAIFFSGQADEQKLFHGFLAVDFFFILSGFVMGYAYDEKWKCPSNPSGMSIKDFVLRRLIRLHPMVVFGVIVGIISFLCQGSTDWNGQIQPLYKIIGAFILALLLLPAPSFFDLRANTEIFSLNGVHWSLFFEYIGSLFYALFIRKFSTKLLAFWTITFAFLLLYIGMSGGSLGNFGWSSDPSIFLGGLCRMLFSYPAGMLLARLFRASQRKQLGGSTFIIASISLFLLLAVPDLKGYNPFYELFCVAVAFPVVLWFAAKGTFTSSLSSKIVSFIGNLSYPLYAVHYPFIYFYIWLLKQNLSSMELVALPLAVAVLSVLVAVGAYKFYDKPLRNYLSKNRL